MRSGRIAAVLAVLVLGTLLALAAQRTPIARVWADEGTFLAMARSVAYDRDLRFEVADRARVEARATSERGAATLILHRDGEGRIAYSKPILFPLLAAPFIAALGDYGPIALNLLLLAGALVLAYGVLRRRGSAGYAALTLVTFAGAAAVVPYVFWRMSDLPQLAMALAGLVLALAPLRPPETGRAPPDDRLERLLRWRGAPLLGAVLLGLQATMRLNNLALAAVPPLAYLLARRWRPAMTLALGALAAFALGMALTAWLTGVANPYRATRTSFFPESGYPAGEGIEQALEHFQQRPATHVTGARPRDGLDRIAYAALYFWIGRHTGVLLYFPAALILLLAAARRPDAVTVATLTGFFAIAVFLVGWMPWNYFGGNTFIGNRYLLAAYPALLLAPRRLPGPRLLALAWALAALAYGSALVSEARAGDLDRTSQSHARAGAFRLLPYESTAQDLSGVDRYWAGDFVRAVDPFVRMGEQHLEISSDRPAGELLIARWQDTPSLRLLVATRARHAELTISDYRGDWRYEVGTAATGRNATVIDVTPSPPWRRHRFWFYPENRYWARALRLAIAPHGDATPPEPITATVRYLGDPESLTQPPPDQPGDP